MLFPGQGAMIPAPEAADSNSKAVMAQEK